jgi:NAD(P)-dependent dehydrogenase (short-subunit alcohol dehydrogenase family)
MVALHAVQDSNSRLATSLPAGMVAVFVGATSGIGEHAVKTFAQCTTSPKIYIVGRSLQSADRILAECRELNPHGQYIFISSDVSLLKNVGDVCQQILAKEPSINLLFQSQGSILMSSELPYPSLFVYTHSTGRLIFFILNRNVRGPPHRLRTPRHVPNSLCP